MSVVPRQCVPLGKKQSPGEPSQISWTYRQPWQLMYAEARLTKLATFGKKLIHLWEICLPWLLKVTTPGSGCTNPSLQPTTCLSRKKIVVPMVTIFHSRHSLGYHGYRSTKFWPISSKSTSFLFIRERERVTSSQAIVTPSLAQPRHTQRKHESKE